MKKQYYYWIGAAAVGVALVVALFLWKGKSRFFKPAEKFATEEPAPPEIILRELLEEKADEEKFSEAARQVGGTDFDSLSTAQQLDVLLRLADDSEATNRLLAVRKLSEMETADHARMQKLIDKLRDENTWVVEQAVLALMKLRASEAIAPLQQLLTELRQQPQTEYVPFGNTDLVAIHGRILSSPADGERKSDFSFQLASFATPAAAALAQPVEREKMGLFVPANFEVCYTLPHFQTNWKKLQNSVFAKQLIELQAWEDFKAAAPFNHFFKLQEKLDATLGPMGGKINYLIDPLGDEVYLAFYPVGKVKSVLLVTPASLKAKTADALLKGLGKVSSGDLIVEQQQYRGQSLFHLSLAPKTSLFRYAVVDGYLVISNNQQLLVRAIASYLNAEENSLAYHPAFRQTIAKVGSESFAAVYVDPKKFFDIKKDARIAATGTLLATVKQALQETTGEPVILSPDSLDRQNPMARAAAPLPVDPQALRFIPADAIFCYATTMIQPSAFWQYVTTRRAEREAIKAFETRSNLNLDRDLIGKMDNQLFYFFAGIDTTGPRFFWRQLIGVRLRDSQNLEKYCKNLLTYLYSPKEGVQVEKYEGVSIHYVQSPTTFEPNFAVVQSYLLMAFDRATLRAAIDAGQKRAEALEKVPGFATTRSRLNAPENALAYFSVAGFLENYRHYLGAYDRQTNLFDQSDLQQRIDPLFALLQATAETGVGKFISEGEGEVILSLR